MTTVKIIEMLRKEGHTVEVSANFIKIANKGIILPLTDKIPVEEGFFTNWKVFKLPRTRKEFFQLLMQF